MGRIGRPASLVVLCIVLLALALAQQGCAPPSVAAVYPDPTPIRTITPAATPTDTTTAAPPVSIRTSALTGAATDVAIAPVVTPGEGLGETSVEAFKDGKQAAISLMFDDSLVSQADNALPALIARGLTGSFYINPGKWAFSQREAVWRQAPAQGMELANHTMNHIGARDYAEADREIGEAARQIWMMQPKPSPLLSFSAGGGVTWNITDEEMAELQARYYSPQRPPWKSMTGARLDNMIAVARGALSNGIWTPVLFHGVAGDYSSVSLSDFNDFLDYLVSEQDRLWIANHIDAYKYTQERDTTTVHVVEATESVVRLELVSEVDPVIYDFPLTLRTNVPPEWATVEVVQNDVTRSYPASDGVVRYEALPGRGEVVLRQGE